MKAAIITGAEFTDQPGRVKPMVERLQVGIGQVDITPLVGTPLDGYIARPGPSVAVHDPLLAQVLIFDDGERRAALVTLDMLSPSRPLTERLRRGIAADARVDPDAILIVASHTHAGPTGLQDWFPVGSRPALDDALVSLVERQVKAATRDALASLRPVTLHAAQGDISGVGGDRNDRDRAVDSTMTVMRFDRVDGSPYVIALHYACHPTVLSAANREISADFPGALRRDVAARFPGATCVFVNGAAGNVSTRFTRRDQSFAEVERLGNRLAERVSDLLSRTAAVESPRLAWASEEIRLPFRDDFAPVTNVAPTGNARIDQTRAEGVALNAELAAALAGRAGHTVALSALAIGPIALLAVPGEPFDAMQAALRDITSFALVLGYANDYAGYFPTPDAIEAGTYEALSSPYDARAHDLILDGLRRLLHRLSLPVGVTAKP